MKNFESFTASSDERESENDDQPSFSICAQTFEVRPEDIVAYRKKMNLTQEQFSKQLGISRRVLQSWELADRTPSAPSQSLLKAAICAS